VSMQYAQVHRRYDGSPDPALQSDRRDNEREITLGVEWRPRPYLGISSTLQRLTRSSNAPGLDFNNTSVSIGAHVEY
jgi:hypothetical protein